MTAKSNVFRPNADSFARAKEKRLINALLHRARQEV
jgi:hypothetical protein